jgi:hypothetical protein
MAGQNVVEASGRVGDADAVRELAELLDRLFIERRDVKAWQTANGKYLPDRTQITMSDLCAHLSGERTLGHYLLSREDKCRLLAFDIDLATTGVWDGRPIDPRGEFGNAIGLIREGLTGQVLIVAERLARVVQRELGVPVAIAFSGSKGCHVFGFTGSEAASLVRDAALDVIEACGCFRPLHGANFFAHENDDMSCQVEVFPKQSSLKGKDLGNLLRLPLGRNLKSGNESFFVRTGGGRRSEFWRMDPLAALGGQLPWRDR